jgi:hypothetical protein
MQLLLTSIYDFEIDTLFYVLETLETNKPNSFP